MQRRFVLLLTLALHGAGLPWSHLAHANDEQGKYTPLKPKVDNCSTLLTGVEGEKRSHRIVFSGRDEDVAGQLQAYADFLFGKPGAPGLAEKLGLSSVQQIIQFMPGSEVNAIAANGRMPVGHWAEGAKIVNRDTGGLLYEMVIAGGQIRHSIYRDDLSVQKQMSILNHVLGHVHFGAHTVFRNSRQSIEINHAAFEFDHYLEGLKKIYDREEISTWYQYLLSLEWSQDLLGGPPETVEDFRPESADVTNARRAETSTKNPKRPTASVMQAFVANLPLTTPKWKREMAERFARMVAYIPGAINTKIMNEGFATLLQELIPPHTEFNKFVDLAEYCSLCAGVTRPSLSNPYWLGLESWRQIRKRFNDRPEIKGLDALERDRRFLAYATQEVIQKMDDKQFLRLGLDPSWLAKYNLVLTRKVPHEEWDPNLPPPKRKFKEPHQFEIVTRDPDRVREAIINSVKGFEFQFPKALLTDLNAQATGVVALEISDPIGRQLEVNRKTLAPTLLVKARFMNQPVSLESTVVQINYLSDPTMDSDRLGGVYHGGFMGPMPPWWRRRELNPRELKNYLDMGYSLKQILEMFNASISRVRKRVIVYPNGEVKAFTVMRNNSPLLKDVKFDLFNRADDRGVEVKLVEDLELKTELENTLASFQADLDLGNQLSESVGRLTSRMAIEEAVSDAANHRVPAGLLLSVPTTPHAIEEFWNYANRRSFAAMRRAILQGRGIIPGKNSVRVKVFPDIPTLRFSPMSVTLAVAEMPTPTAAGFMASLTTFGGRNRIFSLGSQNFSSDAPLDIGVDPGGSGKKIWGEGNPGNGNGNGDGDDGEDGQPGDEPGNGRDPGAGGKDPSYMDFDLKTYAQALDEYVTLPNLRPLEGRTPQKDYLRGGWDRRRNGPLVEEKIFARALQRGRAYYVQHKLPLPDDYREIVRTGLRLMSPTHDYVVRHVVTEPNPDINAVVFIKLDLSGSFHEYVKQAKQMIFDMRALLLRKYKNVKFVFIAFDGSAVATEDPDEFFRLQLGGGTEYQTAFAKELELYSEYPESKFDRFSLLFGDMDDGNSDRLEELMTQVRQQSRFMGAVRMRGWDGESGTLVEQLLKTWSDEDPYVSYVDLAPGNLYSPIDLRRLFKNDEK